MSAVRADAIPPLIDRDTIAGLDDLARNLDREQLIWSSGYLAGLAVARAAPAAAPASAPAPAAADDSPCLILYATETGNCRRVAQAVDQQMRDAGLSTRLCDLRDFDVKSLRRARRATFVVATHGLGDPPEGTEAFFEFWTGDRAPKLEGLSYSVLALGDSTYEDFCGIGRELDARLEALGARRIHERVDCDVDFEDDAAAWRDAVVEAVAEAVRADGAPAGGAAPTVTSLHPAMTALAAAAPTAQAHGRDRPFTAEILVNQKITGRQSSKDVRHVELSLEGSGLTYEPGDAIGVWHENPPELVGTLLDLTRLDGDAEVAVAGDTMPLRDALTQRLEITKLSRGFAQAYADVTGDAELKRVLESADAAREYLAPRQIVDVIAEHPGPIDAAGLAGALRKLTPRLYSVASSLDACPDEAHLTVGVVAYERFGRGHVGAASSFLASDAHEAKVYVEPNDHFRLPRDPDLPVIMIGAGTGVAPYRAFLQHRQLHGAGGDSWLIYGDRTMREDFLYQIEWLRSAREGALSRMTVAFSRDQADKIYVQNRIAESAADLYDWLERGAHVYVCGEAENMAPAVHAALVGVIERVGGRSAEQAEEYLQQMKAAKRYQRDVY